MFEHILVPVDGSPDAEAVLRRLRGFPRPRRSRLVLVRALEPAPAWAGVDVPRLLDRDRAEALRYVRELMGRLAGLDGPVGGRLREGAPANVILHAAEEEGATLIAMARGVRSALERWFFGDWAEEVVCRARVPVLLARADTAPEAPPRRILLPSSGGEAALARGLAVARPLGAEVVVLRVGPGGEGAAAALARRLAEAGVRARALGATGEPAEAILRIAAETGADLISIGLRPRRGWARFGLSGVAERVIRNATIPVLVDRRAA